MNPQARPFFGKATNTPAHLVHNARTSHFAVTEPVLDYDVRSARTGTASLDTLLAVPHAEHLELAWIVETHLHADHLRARGT